MIIYVKWVTALPVLRKLYKRTTWEGDMAARKGHLEVVPYLVHQGAGKEKAINDSWSPLYGAVCQGHLAVVQYRAMEALVDVNTADNDGWSPLHAAANEGHVAIMRCLMMYAALLDVRNSAGQVPVDQVAVCSPTNPLCGWLCGWLYAIWLCGYVAVGRFAFVSNSKG